LFLLSRLSVNAGRCSFAFPESPNRPDDPSSPYYQWHIGSTITVHINENKVMGMDSHSLSLNLRNIALKYNHDLLGNGMAYDWATHLLTISRRLSALIPPCRTARCLNLFPGTRGGVQVPFSLALPYLSPAKWEMESA
jgi:hypothetical protein